MPHEAQSLPADEEETLNGRILILDIVDFSKLKGRVQASLVQHLWQGIRDHPLVQQDENEAYFNGTGDGALIAFPCQKKKVHEQAVIELADSLITHMQGGKTSVDMRAGIHSGRFHIVDVGVGGRQLVGTALNECVRVANIGDHGHIVVSEEFVREWLKEEDVRPTDFQPHPPNDPFVVFVKHGEPRAFRIYRRGRRSKMSPPKKLARVQMAEKQIMRALSEIEAAFCRGIAAADDTIAPADVSARVSVLAPQGSFLCSTPLRFHRKNESTVQGKTQYRIDKKQGRGPAGLAFTSHKPYILTGLPDPAEDLPSYEGELMQIGLRADQVRGMQRKARAFIEIPFSLENDGADGVICIDTTHPLDGVKRPLLQAVADELHQSYSTVVAALWQLRIAI